MTDSLDYYDPQGLSTAFYDVVSHFDPTLQGEVDFYAALIPEGTWVLELGCGTGRIGLPLAERNRAVVGLDLAPAMLTRAQAKRATMAPEVIARTAFVQGDMSAFSLNHRFDAVIAPFFGFSHLPRGAARRKTFEMIARHLEPGGVAAIHVVSHAVISAVGPADPERVMLDVSYDQEGRRLRVYAAQQSFEPTSQTFEQIFDYVISAPDGTEERRSRERLTLQTSNLEADARGSGLVLKKKISPYNEVGEMWVFRRV